MEAQEHPKLPEGHQVSQLWHEILAVPSVKRLADVGFLGAIDYILPEEKIHLRSNRLEHSKSVALLAFWAATKMDLSERDRKLALVGGLLHDVGHPPFSHSIEPVVQEATGFNHHDITKFIISGSLGWPSTIRHHLQRHKIDADEVISLLDGTRGGELQHIFCGPFNVDTLDGITRSISYLTGRKNRLAEHYLMSLLCNDGTNVDALDEFWRMKGFIYNKFIFGPIGLAADELSRYMFRDWYSGGIDIYRCSDADILNSIDHLSTQLKNIIGNRVRFPSARFLSKEIAINLRDFIINYDVYPTSFRRTADRYYQRKSVKFVETKEIFLYEDNDLLIEWQKIAKQARNIADDKAGL